MILFLRHGPRPRTNPNADNAAGGVALGWVPLVLFLRFAYLFVLLEHVGTHLLCWNWWRRHDENNGYHATKKKKLWIVIT